MLFVVSTSKITLKLDLPTVQEIQIGIALNHPVIALYRKVIQVFAKRIIVLVIVVAGNRINRVCSATGFGCATIL